MTMDGFLSLVGSLWVVWLFGLFAGIVIYVYRPRNKKRFQEAADLPLRDDPEEAASRPETEPKEDGEPKDGEKGEGR